MMKKILYLNERGSALIVVMMLLVMCTVVALSMHNVSDDDITISGNTVTSSRAFYAAEAGMAMAQSTLWTDYINWGSTNPQKLPGETASRSTYVTFLEQQVGLNDSATITIVNNFDLGTGQQVSKVDVTRQDMGSSTVLTVLSQGTSDNNSTQTITSVLQIEGEAFKGFEFAVLANNVNCIMCHATFDNVDRVYNVDAAKVGTFDRVKIASLESMLLRTDKADSHVAGTVYTRGIVTDKSGNPITNLSPTGGGLEGYAMNSTDGKIQEPLNTVSLTNTTGTPLPQFGNLYFNYPSTEGDMTDGNLPSDFPPPFSDDNGNKLIDQSEYDAVANAASGAISGGLIYGVMGNYNQGSLPSSGNKTSISKEYSGNLILVGTDANPIVISGDIAVDGDVIIQGKVEGTGQVFARGNVYVTGDLTYADGTDGGGNRTFGTSTSGGRNAFSVAAGKNIMVGDYLTPKKGDFMDNNVIDPGNLTGGEDFSFAMSEVTLFNRREWTKTQQFLPDMTNNMVPNATYDPAYVPRYYTMNAGDPVYIYNKPDYDPNNGKVNGTYWDATTNSWQGKEHQSKYDMTTLSKLDSGDPQLTGASIVAMSSTSDWISAQNLKSIWIDDENARSAGDKFKIDGQLYTNNSIFALTRKAQKTAGMLQVNGSLIASDVGVLSGGGLNLNYDQRMKSFLNVKDNSKVGLTMVAWYAQ